MSFYFYASVNSKHQHPPPPGTFFEVFKSPAPGRKFFAKVRPLGQILPTPGEYLRKSSKPCLLMGVEISEFYRNQTFKNNWDVSPTNLWSYSLVEIDFFTGKQQVIDQFEAEKSPNVASTENLDL